jgi:hypothetical protein
MTIPNLLFPGGFPPGNYSAQLLSTGELVPNSGSQPTLQSTRIESALVLSWPNRVQLFSATNVTGPYLPVAGASIPWTNSSRSRRNSSGFKIQCKRAFSGIGTESLTMNKLFAAARIAGIFSRKRRPLTLQNAKRFHR